jgi:predicted phosphodiesterase
MRYAVISDIHSNLEALRAVKKEIVKQDVDKIIFLGDIVGYGPDPNECIEAIKDLSDILIAGNHDFGAVGMTDIGTFNTLALTAIGWTIGLLTNENKRFLKQLPLSSTIKDENIFLVHSTPREPERWHYLLDSRDAGINFKHFNEKVCFLGHSHRPAIMELAPDGTITVYKESSGIKEGCRYIVNVGSVGQPRDGNPDAAYVIYDTDSVEIKRVSYDIVLTQKRMREAGLPSLLIKRLEFGR